MINYISDALNYTANKGNKFILPVLILIIFLISLLYWGDYVFLEQDKANQQYNEGIIVLTLKENKSFLDKDSLKLLQKQIDTFKENYDEDYSINSLFDKKVYNSPSDNSLSIQSLSDLQPDKWIDFIKGNETGYHRYFAENKKATYIYFTKKKADIKSKKIQLNVESLFHYKIINSMGLLEKVKQQYQSRLLYLILFLCLITAIIMYFIFRKITVSAATSLLFTGSSFLYCIILSYLSIPFSFSIYLMIILLFLFIFFAVSLLYKSIESDKEIITITESYIKNMQIIILLLITVLSFIIPFQVSEIIVFLKSILSMILVLVLIAFVIPALAKEIKQVDSLDNFYRYFNFKWRSSFFLWLKNVNIYIIINLIIAFIIIIPLVFMLWQPDSKSCFAELNNEGYKDYELLYKNTSFQNSILTLETSFNPLYINNIQKEITDRIHTVSDEFGLSKSNGEKLDKLIEENIKVDMDWDKVLKQIMADYLKLIKINKNSKLAFVYEELIIQLKRKKLLSHPKLNPYFLSDLLVFQNKINKTAKFSIHSELNQLMDIHNKLISAENSLTFSDHPQLIEKIWQLSELDLNNNLTFIIKNDTFSDINNIKQYLWQIEKKWDKAFNVKHKILNTNYSSYLWAVKNKGKLILFIDIGILIFIVLFYFLNKNHFPLHKALIFIGLYTLISLMFLLIYPVMELYDLLMVNAVLLILSQMAALLFFGNKVMDSSEGLEKEDLEKKEM